MNPKNHYFFHLSLEKHSHRKEHNTYDLFVDTRVFVIYGRSSTENDIV